MATVGQVVANLYGALGTVKVGNGHQPLVLELDQTPTADAVPWVRDFHQFVCSLNEQIAETREILSPSGRMQPVNDAEDPEVLKALATILEYISRGRVKMMAAARLPKPKTIAATKKPQHKGHS